MSPTAQPRLIVALDTPDLLHARELARRLGSVCPKGPDGKPAPEAGRLWFKLGLELFTAAGPEAVTALKQEGFPVFLDLKLHDIPNTVAGAVQAACRTGADMLTLHASGGPRMLRAAVDARDGCGGHTLLVAVTVLTSLSDDEAQAVYGAPSREVARELAATAYSQGLDGVVCSGHEVEAIKAATSPAFLCVTPGIRPPAHPGEDAAAAQADQRRVMTPEQAVAAGSDFLVVGRPITQADDPARAAREMLAAMDRARP